MHKSLNTYLLRIGKFFTIILFVSSPLLAVTSTFSLTQSPQDRNYSPILKSTENCTLLTISGDTDDLSTPKIAKTRDNTIFISWERNIRGTMENDNYGANDEIYIQKLNQNGSIEGDHVLLANCDTFSYALSGIACSNILVDSEDNLNLIWFVLDYDGNASGQLGHIHFMKIDKDLNIIVEGKSVFSYVLPGWGSSPSPEEIKASLIDTNDHIHLLFGNYFYICLDTLGNVIGYYDVEQEDIGAVKVLEVDSYGNIFILSEKSYDFIYFLRLNNTEMGTIELDKKLLAKDVENIIRPFDLTCKDEELFAIWINKQDEYTKIMKQIDFSGNIIADRELCLGNLGFHILSDNASIDFVIDIDQFSCNLQDVDFYYSLYTFENSSLVEKHKILSIQCNEEYSHGPSIFGLGGLEDKNGDLWLVWFVNDGNNGFQILLWKLKPDGTELFPVISLVPDSFCYSNDSNFCPIEALIHTSSQVDYIPFITLVLILPILALKKVKKKNKVA